ncbi:D-alanyl-D-alanine carboxypeptidase/D-alanyl-D-alanine endopeptidase [Ideonella oryzae]|uniref:D-alanyl-D-alanine carboxypeptidase/D-alanyl-D-alanine-endopeptidase n=1 Tax=Ideonella oryzae TaxID=2937441 RepID=A0ABT1BLL2_9BURK|nr:D-alanyl-D-alanine carboxypeptidase/D-alanyl-D-alanine-endopeptidase [Ideonella oryzae]MCO5977120.1 D-alanyl-D-alanine carboxypeptidase/D-alanyl-D-alanine-endopeptidase [Ideonella oryzae]
MRGTPCPPRRVILRLSLLYLPLLAPLAQAAPTLPPGVQAALRRAQVPAEALSAVVQEVGSDRPLWSLGADIPRNPASVFKLLTTYAALDQLGPAWTWQTPVYLTGPVHDGVLDGSVLLRGSGDPGLVLERVWLLLHHLQQRGVRGIRGDIVLDRSAWQLPPDTPADFDGEPSKPYNVQPDALLLNYKTLTLHFSPMLEQGVARVSAEPRLAGVNLPETVPLSKRPCGDWRAGLQPDWSDPAHIRLSGSLGADCGEKDWPVAYADPARYNALLIAQLWQEMGGRLDGQVKEGTVPPQAVPTWQENSPPLAEVVRNINKFSNNLMAEQLFLTLGMLDRPDPSRPATPDDARTALRSWLAQRLGPEAATQVVVDKGSGLSRETRISAQQLATLLLQAWRSPVMSELMSSLPVSGVDGTLKRSTATGGRAHLKTGSLRDAAAQAGYVLSRSGRRYVLVALVNDEQAGRARPALEALTQWVMDDAPGP